MRWLDRTTNSMDTNLSKLQTEWRTRKPGVLQSMSLQRLRHDLVTEQQQQQSKQRAEANKWTMVIGWRPILNDVAVGFGHPFFCMKWWSICRHTCSLQLERPLESGRRVQEMHLFNPDCERSNVLAFHLFLELQGGWNRLSNKYAHKANAFISTHIIILTSCVGPELWDGVKVSFFHSIDFN